MSSTCLQYIVACQGSGVSTKITTRARGPDQPFRQVLHVQITESMLISHVLTHNNKHYHVHCYVGL